MAKWSLSVWIGAAGGHKRGERLLQNAWFFGPSVDTAKQMFPLPMVSWHGQKLNYTDQTCESVWQIEEGVIPISKSIRVYDIDKNNAFCFLAKKKPRKKEKKESLWLSFQTQSTFYLYICKKKKSHI